MPAWPASPRLQLFATRYGGRQAGGPGFHPPHRPLPLPLFLVGERYEGEWREGVESGTGTLVAADGGTCYAGWQGGQMHGRCVYTPPAAEVVFLRLYDWGRLQQEQVLRVAHKDVRKKQQKKEGKKKGGWLGGRVGGWAGAAADTACMRLENCCLKSVWQLF